MRPFLLTLTVAIPIAIAIAWCWLMPDAHVDVPANALAAPADIEVPADADAGTHPGTVARSSDAAEEPDPAAAPRIEAPELVAPSKWRIHVTDPSGAPVVGALVDFGSGRARQTTTTDREGVAGFASVPRHATNVRVRAGSRHAEASCGAAAPAVTLPWFGPLHGRLVDRATAKPIAGATVVHRHHGCRICDGDRTATDANGDFVLPAVPRDQGATFEFEAPEYPLQTVPLRLPGRGEPVAHTFAIERGVVIAGRCVDAASRRGLAEVKVSDGRCVTTSAADGSFRLLHLASGTEPTSLTLAAPGYLRPTYEVPQSPPDVAPEFALLPATQLVGRVVSTTGEPIVGARVRAERRDRISPPASGATYVDEAQDAPRAVTEERGTFVVRGLVPGRAYELEAKAFDFTTQPDQEPVVARADQTAPIVLVLTPTAAIPTGTIVGTFRRNGVQERGRIDWQMGRRTMSVVTKADGSFRCVNVPAGAVQLTATCEAAQGDSLIDGGAMAWRRQVVLRADEELRVDVDLQLDLVPITGRVRNADGSPVGAHMVDVLAADLQRSLVTTSDGRFQVDVPRTIGAVVLEIPCSTRVETQPGAQDVELVLPASGTVRYRVRGEDGTPGSFEQVWFPAWRYSNCGTGVHAPDLEGFFERRAAQGDRLFLCSAAGHAPSLRSVQVGAQTTVDVVLGRGTSVRVRLGSGAPPPDSSGIFFVDARLTGFRLWDVIAVDGELARWVQLRAEGDEVQRVEAGTYRFVAADPAVEFSPPTFVVGTEPVVVDVTWARRVK